MIAMDNKIFEGDDFAIQVIARGAYIDEGSGADKIFAIESTVIRLNHVALNTWIMSRMGNCRDCYVDGEEGDREWEAHKAKMEEESEAFKAQIIYDLGIDTTDSSVCITQALSEVFTVVHIRKID